MAQTGELKSIPARVPIEMIKLIEKIQKAFEIKKGTIPSSVEVMRMIAFEINRRPLYVT